MCVGVPRMHTELLSLIADQQKAIDHLLGMLVERDAAFIPAQSGVWRTVEEGRAALSRFGWAVTGRRPQPPGPYPTRSNPESKGSNDGKHGGDHNAARNP